MAVRDMEMTGEVEDSSLIAEDQQTSSNWPRSRLSRKTLAAGAALFGVAVLFGTLVVGRPASGVVSSAAASVEKPGADLVRADSEPKPKGKFPWGFDVVEECGTEYHIKKVLHSNLGHQGPDNGAEGIKYLCEELEEHVYKRDVIVEINAKSHYHSKSAHMNGKSHDFGSVHIDAGSHVDLLVKFKNVDEEPIHLPLFRMTFYDLDEAPGHLSQEYIIAEGHPGTHMDGHTEVNEKHLHGDLEFLASEVGGGADNPRDSKELTHLQQDRSVVLTYHHKKEFHVTLGSKQGHSPRAFEFALHSPFDCHKVKLAKTTTITTTITSTSTTSTSTVTTTTIDPAIAEARNRLIEEIIAGVLVVAAFIALITWLSKKEEREIAFFDGTS